jgi:hypothetical protein
MVRGIAVTNKEWLVVIIWSIVMVVLLVMLILTGYGYGYGGD